MERFMLAILAAEPPQPLILELNRSRQSPRQRADISRIAAAAAANVIDPFRPCGPAELDKFPARDLDGLQIIRKSRLARKTMAIVGGAKRGRLRGERHVH